MILVYDIFGNLIGEYNADGTLRSEWVYLGNHRLAMITESEGGGGFPGCDQLPPPQCGIWGDSVALNWAIIGIAPFLVWAGFKYRRKPKVLLLVFMAGFGIIIFMIAFEARPNSESLTPNSESVFYYHNDHLGTPKVITDQNGVIQWEAVMEPFGEIDTFIASNANNPFRFPGQYEDELTGMYYNINRYYLPDLARYGKYDPIKIYLILSINSYSYVKNNPIIYKDLLGLMQSCCLSEIQNELPKIDKNYDEFLLMKKNDPNFTNSLLELLKWWFGRDSQVCADVAFELADYINARGYKCCEAQANFHWKYFIGVANTVTEIWCNQEGTENMFRRYDPFTRLLLSGYL